MKEWLKSRSIFQIVAYSIIAIIMVVGVVSATTNIGTNISTGGNITSAGSIYFDTASSTGNSLIKVANINSSTGTISFDNEILTTTGAVNFATASSTGLAKLNSASFGNGTTAAHLLFGTCTVDFNSISASSTAVTTCTATGVTTSHKVFVTPVMTNNHIIFNSASSTLDDTIQVAAYNTGVTGDINPDSATWEWLAIK